MMRVNEIVKVVHLTIWIEKILQRWMLYTRVRRLLGIGTLIRKFDENRNDLTYLTAKVGNNNQKQQPNSLSVSTRTRWAKGLSTTRAPRTSTWTTRHRIHMEFRQGQKERGAQFHVLAFGPTPNCGEDGWRQYHGTWGTRRGLNEWIPFNTRRWYW